MAGSRQKINGQILEMNNRGLLKRDYKKIIKELIKLFKA